MVDVAVSIVGNLGNQLFQFAAAKAVQADPAQPVAIDSRVERPWEMKLAPVLQDQAFRLTTRPELLRLRQWPFASHQSPLATRIARRVMRSASWSERHVYVDDPSNSLLCASAEGVLNRPLLLQGYFQIHALVEHHAQHVLNSFRPPSDIAASRIASARGMANGKSVVGISYRAGSDYRDFGVVLPWEYFANAIAMIRSRVDVGAFVILGDEPAMIGDVAALTGPVPVVLGVDLLPVDQLNLMSLADHLIISNSTFAWWGAWLGDNRTRNVGRLVVAPDPWLSSPNHIYSPTWIKLSSRTAHDTDIYDVSSQAQR